MRFKCRVRFPTHQIFAKRERYCFGLTVRWETHPTRFLKFILFLLILPLYLNATFDVNIENSNFLLSTSAKPFENKTYLYNYNRLRAKSYYKQDDYFAKIIGDVVTYIGKEYINSPSFAFTTSITSKTPFKTQTNYYKQKNFRLNSKLYRFYGGYDNGENRIVAGLQNINIGTGHIWTPSNIFNPKNSYALEPDETFGILALYMAHYFENESQLYGAISQNEENDFKGLLGYKFMLNEAEVSLNIIESKNVKMLAYALATDLLETGIELRSEGAYLKTSDEVDFFQNIIGLDYAFENGINLTVESRYTSKSFDLNTILSQANSDIALNFTQEKYHLGVMMNYTFNIYLSSSLLFIESMGDNFSLFVSPSLTYTINDNNELTLGAIVQNGSKKSEFGVFGNSFYVRYGVGF